ncbi:MAG TPA: PAS domain-containing protein, partial [Candidatus Acidoferrum sp.]|nr:PAS domain-containing protein [Candidatus Acidoferrum sp.]
MQLNPTSKATANSSSWITMLKEAEEKLFTEKTQTEAILDGISDGVLAIDISGKITVFNHAAVSISGASVSNALHKPYQEVLAFHNANGIRDDSFVAGALSGKRVETTHNTTLRRIDGTVVPVARSATPFINAKGETEGAVIVFRDMTNEKQVEHMKDEFLSVASHELRTPMGAVRANIAMILSGDYGPVNQGLIEPLTDMKASTIRLVELVSDLLDVARIEADRMLFALGDFAIEEVLRSVAANLAPLGKEKGVRILIAKDNGDATVQADPDKIAQVLTSLIRNSLKFTSKGSVTVTVSLQKDMVEIAVSDTGIGIAKEDQKKLFGKFKQITSA